jgi:hypothetical protein
MLVVPSESEEFSDFLHIAGSDPDFHFINLCLLHLYHAFCYSDAQKVEVVLFKGTFFWVEVKVIFVEPVEDLSDQKVVAGDMFFFHLPFLVPSVDGYVVHVDCYAPSIDKALENSVHHSLEGGG